MTTIKKRKLILHSILLMTKVYFILAFLLISCNSSADETDLSAEALLATENGNWKKAAALSEKWYQSNPKDAEANYQAATNYLKWNAPTKALQILNSYQPHDKYFQKEINWREARLAKAYYMTGQFDKVLEVAKNHPFPKTYRGLAREHLKALIQLGQFEALENQLAIYQKKGIYRKNGKTTNTDFLFRAICNELVLVDNQNQLEHYAQTFQQWIHENKNTRPLRNLPFAKFYLKNYEEAIEILPKSILEEKSPRHLMELQMLLGVCFAKKGNEKKANLQIEKINAMEKLPNRHDAFGAKYYHQARIELAMGKQKEALENLSRALANKAEFWSYKFREDSFLINLFDHLSFQNMIESKDN